MRKASRAGSSSRPASARMSKAASHGRNEAGDEKGRVTSSGTALGWRSATARSDRAMQAARSSHVPDVGGISISACRTSTMPSHRASLLGT